MENLEKKYYIRKGIGIPVITGIELNPAGTTEQDYEDEKFIEITEQQADFYKQNPTASFSEIINMKMTSLGKQYKDLVISKIRVIYSDDDEHAIQRKRDTEPDEFAKYNAYCEQCKIEAKQELGLEEE